MNGRWSLDVARARIAAAAATKMVNDAIYREAVELVLPDRNGFTSRRAGSNSAARSWDSTPGVSLLRTAGRYSSTLTPQFSDWVEIRVGPAGDALSQEQFSKQYGASKSEISVRLAQISKVVNAVFQAPDFATATSEMYVDYLIGQGGLLIEERPMDSNEKPIGFRAMPISSFHADEGARGQLSNWYFWEEIRPSAVMDHWNDARPGEELARVIQMAQQGPSADKPVKFCTAIYWADGRFFSDTFFVHGSAKKVERIVEREHAESPCVTPRYFKLSGEDRGRGPVIFALPDIRTANKIVELSLRSASLAAAGVWLKDSNIEGKVSIRPGAMISVRSAGPSEGIRRLDTGADLSFGQLLLEKLHENIKITLGDTSLPPEAGPVRTATEFIQRARELIQDQSAAFARLYAEFIVPSVRRVVDILERRQMIDMGGMKVDGFWLEARLKSPMARDEALQAVENLVRFIDLLKAIGGDELAMVIADIEGIAVDIGKMMDVPEERINAPDVRKKAKEGIQAMMKQQALAAPQEAGAENVGT